MHRVSDSGTRRVTRRCLCQSWRSQAWPGTRTSAHYHTVI